jgi:HK97 family phage major capsid protein
MELEQIMAAVQEIAAKKDASIEEIAQVKTQLQAFEAKQNEALETKTSALEAEFNVLKEQFLDMEAKGAYSMDNEVKTLTVKQAQKLQAEAITSMLKNNVTGAVKAVNPMNTQNSESAGVTISEVIEAGIIKPLKDYSPILSQIEVATINSEKAGSRRVRVTGAGSRYTTENIAGAQAENTSVPNYKVIMPTFGHIEASPAITLEMMQDSDYDMPSEIQECVDEEFREQLAHMALRGDGIEMKGLLDHFGTADADSVRAYDTYQALERSVDFGVKGKATAANLLAMIDATPSGHVDGSKFYMNRQTYNAFLLLEDENKRPLVYRDWTLGAPASIFGHQVVIDPSMPGLNDAGQVAVIFGDMAAAFKFFYVHGLHTEIRSPAPRLIQYYHSLRVGSRVSQVRALKGLRNPLV